MHTRTPLRLLGLAASLSLVAGLLPSTASAEIGDAARATSAAGWLAKQAPKGYLTSFGTQPDWGLTSDAVLGMVAAGATPAQIAPLANAVERQVGTNYGITTFEGAKYVDAAALSKLLVIASVTGANTASYGGVNIRERVLAEVQPNGFVGKDSPANLFGQSYAILGLARTGSLPASTVTALLKQQCSSGYFRLTQSATPCANGTDPADRDATALAVMALKAAKAKGISAANAPLDRALTWLVTDQRPSGAWIGSPWTTDENSNSTGLVSGAMAGLRTGAVTKATAWMRTVQFTSGADAGAIAYSKATFADATGGVVDPSTRYQWLRATTQALLAFKRVDFGTMAAIRVNPVDVYSTPGTHTVNGRQWRTTCEPYSRTTRCRTEIWATTVSQVGASFVQSSGWTFNNLTYLPTMTQAEWGSNPLAKPGTHTIGGRQWKTECHTPGTGKGACRSFILAKYIASQKLASGGYRYYWTQGWLFNNMVRFRAWQ